MWLNLNECSPEIFKIVWDHWLLLKPDQLRKECHPNYKEKAIAAAADSDLVMEVHSTAVPDTQYHIHEAAIGPVDENPAAQPPLLIRLLLSSASHSLLPLLYSSLLPLDTDKSCTKHDRPIYTHQPKQNSY